MGKRAFRPRHERVAAAQGFPLKFKYRGKTKVKGVSEARKPKKSHKICGQKTMGELEKMAETHFQPKTILSQEDWLVVVPEKGETFLDYKSVAMDKDHQTIYICSPDFSVSVEFLNQLVKYCEAFFFGCRVELMETDLLIPETRTHYGIT